jgi:DHA2 family multidrug resistance protein
MFHLAGFNTNVDYGAIAWARVYQSLGLALMFIPINTAPYQCVPADKTPAPRRLST